MNKKAKNAIWAGFVIILSVVILSVLLYIRKSSEKVVNFKKKTVNFITIDSVGLRADLFEPTFKQANEKKLLPGVVLLGPLDGSRNIYDYIAGVLSTKGIVVLSVDVRGSGESANQKLSVDQYAKTDLDAEAALQFLAEQESVNPEQLGILGTLVTARSALLGASSNKNVKACGLVSAYLDSIGLQTIKNSPELPIIVVVSLQDGIAGSQAREIFETSANKNSHIEVYINAGEGSQIWQSYVIFEMTKLITNWFWEQLS